MNFISYKRKVYFSLLILLALAVALFGYIYGLVDLTNQSIADEATARQVQYITMQSEQQSYEAGKRDLAVLSEKPYQPSAFFSRDTSLVKEIRTLEMLANQLQINFGLQIAGNVTSAPKIKDTIGEIRAIPSTMVLEGSFENVTQFLDSMEQLHFVIQVKAITITATEGNRIKAVANSIFYLHQ
jgi:hypothetical protein